MVELTVLRNFFAQRALFIRVTIAAMLIFDVSVVLAAEPAAEPEKGIGIKESAACQKQMQSIRRQLFIGSLCADDSECESSMLGCPFGCDTPLSKLNRAQVEESVAVFRKECVNCEYGCVAPKGELKCIESRCARVPEDKEQSPAK